MRSGFAREVFSVTKFPAAFLEKSLLVLSVVLSFAISWPIAGRAAEYPQRAGSTPAAPLVATSSALIATSTALTATATQAATGTAHPDFPFKIYILLYEGVDETPIRKIVPEMEHEFGFPVEIMEKRAPIPADSYDKDRSQYRAWDVLVDAMKYAPRDAVRILAFFPNDMYVGRHLYTFGLADPDGRGAVIATKRLESGEQKRYVARLLKESLHELGHTFGLTHCEFTYKCLMTQSPVVDELDAKPTEFCGSCRAKLAREIKELKENLLKDYQRNDDLK